MTKLFNIVDPHLAFFGEKDYQQLQIIRRLVRDLDFDIEIIGCKTIREQDGLAMSSRNAYLTPEQRPGALSLVESLEMARSLVEGGETDARSIIRAATQKITAYPDTDIDYLSIFDPETLEDVSVIDRPVRMAIAVRVGSTRLIDNMALVP